MDREREALRLKTLAEQNYTSSNLKSALKYATRAHRLSSSLDGLSEALTAFQILSSAAATSPPDWYKILQIDPFSHINIIKKQYKKLALTLHPDKNPFAACEEGFKLVAEGFRVLSDKTRRKEYDVRLRMAMQEAATEGGRTDAPPSVDGFWTECLACRVVHCFDRKYLGHNLMCPSCKKSFRALEVNEGEEDVVGTRVSARIRAKGGGARSVTTSGELCKEGGGLRSNRGEVTGVSEEALEISKSKRARVGEEGITLAEMQMLAKKAAVMGVSGEALENSKSKKAIIGEEGITLSEMQMLAKKKVREEKMRLRVKEKAKEGEKAKKVEKSSASKGGKFEDKKQRKASNGELEIMEVEDSDFYDFDRDRVEKSFKKGQVWAVYDDDDGMPRHYCLIDEVSVYPFKIKLSWLELQIGADERLLSWEKTVVRISCGRFKVAKTDVVDSVNIFSHFVNAERAAREVYRVYPRKGSVWALFNEDASQNKYKRCYDMVVCLTNYDEVYGLSMAYLEKVEGFKSVFKRREIGCHAVKSLEKDDFRLFSHQIPARKLTGEEAPDLSRDCWELDPASLPPELLKIR